MPQMLLFPISITTHETTMIVNINSKSQSTHSHLPDIVTDCEQRLVHSFANDD
ncbi:unnamed protein product, partial [Rotaria magnacalcarata]